MVAKQHPKNTLSKSCVHTKAYVIIIIRNILSIQCFEILTLLLADKQTVLNSKVQTKKKYPFPNSV